MRLRTGRRACACGACRSTPPRSCRRTAADRSAPAWISTRSGTRCTTFTQLPDEFCAGSTENSWSVAGASLCSTPCQTCPGYASTVTVAGLARPGIGQRRLLRLRGDPHVVGIDQTERRRAGGQELARLQLVHLCHHAGERGAHDRCDRSRAAPRPAAPRPACRPASARSAHRPCRPAAPAPTSRWPYWHPAPPGPPQLVLRVVVLLLGHRRRVRTSAA